MKTPNLSLLTLISMRVLIEYLGHSIVDIVKINTHIYEIKTLRHHLNVGTINYVSTVKFDNSIGAVNYDSVVKFEVEFDHEISLVETDVVSRESKEFLNRIKQELIAYDINLEISNETP